MSKRLRNSSIGIVFFVLVAIPVFAANMLTNGAINAPFHTYVGAGPNKNCGGTTYVTKVADGWDGFEIVTSDRMRFFSASDWGKLAACLYGGSPFTESLDGEAQSWVSAKKFDVGIYQVVSGLSIGESYGFSAGIAPAFYTTNRTDPATGKMFRSVGVDPTGGTDPTAPSVIWSPEEPHAVFDDGQKYSWFFPSVGFKAQSSNASVFIRVRSIEDVTDGISINQVWADTAYFDIAPTTILDVTSLTPTQVQVSWNGSPRTGFHLFAYEAQYKKITDTDWTDIQIFDVLDGNNPPMGTNATIAVTTGETYLFRARTWHESESGNKNEVAGPWTEKTFVSGGILNGTLLNNTENAVSGATVAVSGTATQTISATGGAFSFVTGEGTFGITATTTVGWTSPSPVWAKVPITDTADITLTLRPPNDFIDNGDFEGDLGGWASTFLSPIFDSSSPRAGNASLCITEAGTITATAVVTDMYRPTLSFWAKVTGDGDDSLSALIFTPDGFGQSTPITLTQNSDWQHVVLPLNMLDAPTSGDGNFDGGTGTFFLPRAEVYSGSLGVKFTVSEATSPTQFCLDEVSAGGAWGGAEKVFLPLVLR